MARGKVSETKLAEKIIKALRAKSQGKGYWIKMHGSIFSAGKPDIIGCYKGHFFAFELKLPGREDNLTKIQAEHIEEITASGGTAAMATGVNQVLKLVDDAVGWD